MSDSNKAVQTEIAAAAFLAVAAVVALVWLIPNNTQPAASDLDISPAFFPIGTAEFLAGYVVDTGMHISTLFLFHLQTSFVTGHFT